MGIHASQQSKKEWRKKLKEKDSEMSQEMMVYVPTMMNGILKKEIKRKGDKKMKMKNSFNK